jgi:hypothetical protein
MFERYTEKARRVIFFARYEASRYGTPCIETEHILLGVLREDKRIAHMLLPARAEESIREQIAARTSQPMSIPTSVDLPLSNESKRVLAYAAEEAERLAHRHIGSEHLFLGLLREKKCFAEELLRDHGIELEKARQKVGPTESEEVRNERTVTIHDSAWNAGYVDAAAQGCRRFFWQKQTFAAPDISVRRDDGRISFDRKLAEDTSAFRLVEGGWKEVACIICHWEFMESDDPERGEGYTNGRDWLCSECYTKFLAPDPGANSS